MKRPAFELHVFSAGLFIPQVYREGGPPYDKHCTDFYLVVLYNLCMYMYVLCVAGFV